MYITVSVSLSTIDQIIMVKYSSSQQWRHLLFIYIRWGDNTDWWKHHITRASTIAIVQHLQRINIQLGKVSLNFPSSDFWTNLPPLTELNDSNLLLRNIFFGYYIYYTYKYNFIKHINLKEFSFPLRFTEFYYYWSKNQLKFSLWNNSNQCTQEGWTFGKLNVWQKKYLIWI